MSNSATGVVGVVPVPQTWTSFDSVGGSISVYASFNVLSYTYGGTTSYWTINFVNPYQDSHFAAVGVCGPGTSGSTARIIQIPAQLANPTTSSTPIATTPLATAAETTYASIMIVGNKDI